MTNQNFENRKKIFEKKFFNLILSSQLVYEWCRSDQNRMLDKFGRT